MTRLIASFGLLFALGASCICSPPPGPPEPDRCEASAPDSATIAELAMDSATSGEFVPVSDGAPTYLEIGGQGSRMVVLRFGWQSPDPLPCATVSVRILNPSDELVLATLDEDLESSTQAPWQFTFPVYFIADSFGSEIIVELTVYGSTIRRRLRVGGWGEDAGVDSGPADSGP